MIKKAAAAALLVLVPCLALAQVEIGGALPTPLPLFPPDNWWNLDISAVPPDPGSTGFINHIGGGTTLHPDFGGEAGGNDIYGMPYVVVSGSQAKVPVEFEYSDESDGVGAAFYPIPNAAKTQPHYIEGGDPGNVCHGRPAGCGDYQDRHMLIVDRDNKYLYELYSLYWNTSLGKWQAGSGAFFDMNTNDRRPDGWTSADAAGLAILPGLMRYDEVYGPDEINHAIRMTVDDTNGYVYPASHVAGDVTGAVPMGARLRLKSSKNIAGDAAIQKIVRAMKKYGLIVADNGSDMYIGGTFDTRWNNDILNPAFALLKASDFEVVKLGFKPTHTLSVDNVTLPESNSGSTDATFTVTLAVAHTVAITVEYSTADGSATAGDDYLSTSGVLTFDPGVLTQTFTVAVSGDAVGEGNETFGVHLANPTNGTITDADGVGTILNDDPPDISIADASRAEGSTGAPTLTFNVTLSNPYLANVTVDYGTADASAAAGSDYTATSGTLTIPSGSTKGTIVIPVVADTVDEGNETFTITLFNPVNGVVADATGIGTIADDDTAGSVQFGLASYTVAENGVQMVVPVTRSGGAASAAMVDCSTSDGTAQAPADYTAVVRHLVFGAGVTTMNCVVPIVSDTIDEAATETINLTLGNLQNGLTLGAQSTTVVKITDDDTAGAVAFKAALFQVGEAAANAVVTVVRTGGTASGVTVNYATSDGSATAGADYLGTTGTVSFGLNQSSRTFVIPLLGDALAEGNEALTLTLSAPGGRATLGAQSTATLRINDDERGVQLALPNVNVSEGAATVNVNVSRFGPLTGALTVGFVTSNGTAVAPGDYVGKNGTLTFAAGIATRAIQLTIKNDVLNEVNEKFNVTLKNPTNGVLGPRVTGTVTIVDND